jgi:hypothetical protein
MISLQSLVCYFNNSTYFTRSPGTFKFFTLLIIVKYFVIKLFTVKPFLTLFSVCVYLIKNWMNYMNEKNYFMRFCRKKFLLFFYIISFFFSSDLDEKVHSSIRVRVLIFILSVLFILFHSIFIDHYKSSSSFILNWV